MNLSTKNVKAVKELLKEKLFIIPSSMANDRTSDGKPAILVGVGGKMSHIPVGELTPIDYDHFCVMKDSGITINEFGGEFDPC